MAWMLCGTGGGDDEVGRLRSGGGGVGGWGVKCAMRTEVESGGGGGVQDFLKRFPFTSFIKDLIKC